MMASSHAQAQITVKSLIGKAVSDSDSDKYKDTIGEAITRFMHRDPKGALGQLMLAKKDNPMLPPADMMLAQMWLMANQGAQTRAALEECIKNNPTDPEAYLVLADMAFSDRQIAASELLFNKALQLSENFKENQKRASDFKGRAYAGLAAVAESREQWDTAKTDIENWLKVVDPNPTKVPAAQPNTLGAAAHDRLGRVLFHADPENGPKEAYKQFEFAVADDPRSVSPDIALAVLYEDAKNHERAKSFITRAVSHLPTDPTDAAARESNEATLLAAARWALDTNQANDAFSYAQRAYNADPKSKRALEAKYYMGVAARMKGDSATAEKNLEDVYMETPSNFTASNQLAQVLVEQNDADKKQRGLEIAINNQAVAQGEGQRRDPARAIEAASTLGWAFYLLNRIPEADQVTQAVINTSVNASPDIWYYRAKLFQYHGKTDEAIQSLKVATESRGFFIHRQDAQELLASLDKGRTSNPAGASEPSTTKTGASSAPATPASTETPAPAASGSNTATPSSNTATPSGGTDKGSK